MSQMYIKNVGINLRSTYEHRQQAGRISAEQTRAFKKTSSRKPFFLISALMSMGRTLQLFLLPAGILQAVERSACGRIDEGNSEPKADFASICRNRIANLQSEKSN